MQSKSPVTLFHISPVLLIKRPQICIHTFVCGAYNILGYTVLSVATC